MATYTQGIPLATDKPRNTQPVLLENINAIPELLVVDHVGFNVANKGKHLKVTMPRNVPAGAPAAAELRLFTDVGPASAVTELFYQRDGSANTLNMTEKQGGNNSNGWTYLPSGMLMIWGFDTVNLPSPVTILFATRFPAFPGFNGVPHGVISSRNAHTAIFISNITTTSIIIGTDQNTNVYWSVIGLAA